ncbi:MAG: succinyl-diaminopimelate desuccinylase [Micavibrio aeruginosavorus]|uniref:Succinyl-diaminopimelate desuccinylase n=1 Tax=Micavibrio aeruginosavorus TaxID=349221 RepID=A0A2W4ZV95_9BACT|nr:MAG: succinyl-diaminopimelate desuccinylase [Micavibrio aeruginosavorus]
MSQRTVEIAQDLIRFKSITPDDAGAQGYLKKIMTGMGFEVFDLPFEGRGSYRVENFFARRGTGAPHICFAGHTDVVPAGDESAWSVPPFAGEIRNDCLIGRGAADMKGNIAAFVAAIEEFLKERPDFAKGSISILITGDEEKDSINGTARVLEWMASNNHIPDVCLVAEPSNPDYMGQEIKIGRRGSLTGHMTVHGKQGHVAYPDRADNPVPRMIRLLDALGMCVFDKGSAHFQPTNLEVTTVDVGNTATNVIPAKASASFNIRFSDRWTNVTLEEKVRAVLDSVGTPYDIRFTRGASSFLTQPGEWTNLVSEAVERVTDHKPALTTGGGTSDARFVADYCPVVEFGMVNKTIHQVDEFCTLAQLGKCTDIFQEILKLYFR